MSKLIQSNPNRLNTAQYSAWADGFEAGQKSTLAPLSVTGRWWQAKNGNIYFINKTDYGLYDQTTNNSNECRWLTEEETREF